MLLYQDTNCTNVRDPKIESKINCFQLDKWKSIKNQKEEEEEEKKQRHQDAQYLVQRKFLLYHHQSFPNRKVWKKSKSFQIGKRFKLIREKDQRQVKWKLDSYFSWRRRTMWIRISVQWKNITKNQNFSKFHSKQRTRLILANGFDNVLHTRCGTLNQSVFSSLEQLFLCRKRKRLFVFRCFLGLPFESFTCELSLQSFIVSF